MKKILFSLLLIASFAFAQTRVQEYVPFSYGFSKTIGAGWVDTLSRTLDSLAHVDAGYGGVAALATSNSVFDTCTATFKPFSSYWMASIIVDDTCEASTSPTFLNRDKVKILPGVPLQMGWYNTGKTNLYIRRLVVSGAVGTPNYSIYLKGN